MNIVNLLNNNRNSFNSVGFCYDDIFFYKVITLNDSDLLSKQEFIKKYRPKRYGIENKTMKYFVSIKGKNV